MENPSDFATPLQRLGNKKCEIFSASIGSHDSGSKALTDVQRIAVLRALLQWSEGRTIKCGGVVEVVVHCNVKKPTVRRIRKQRIKPLDENDNDMDVLDRKTVCS